MDTQPIANCCPKCQTPLPPDAPQGLCPKCLFAAVATPTEAGQPAGHRPAPPALTEIAAAFPQLEILEFIGQGGMGFVFKARQPKLDRLVALKILPQSLAADPTFAERFNREAKLLARLNHPGIVAVHDFGMAVAAGILPAVEPGVPPGGKGVEISGTLPNSEPIASSSANPGGKMPPSTSGQRPDATKFYYLLMEFVDGVNLRQAMQAGRFTPDQALAIVPKICEALQFAHNEGILHRDIKPENILLDAKGRVKIADFGIAKLVGNVAQASQPAGSGGIPAASSWNTEQGCSVHPQAGKPALQSDALTEAGKTLGSPNYMAPEQLEHPGEVDHRADIYSLGVVFYEMLTGELPLGRFAPPSQKSAADPRVDEVVLRALEKERERRQHSAGEVKTQVETIAADAEKSEVRSPKSELEARSESPERRRRALLWYGFICSVFGLPAGLALHLPFVWGLSIAGIMIGGYKLRLLAFAGVGTIPKKEHERRQHSASEVKTQVETIVTGSSGRESAQTEKSEIGNRKSEMSPRFSRAAIVGAAWLTLFFAVVPAFLWHEIQTHEPIRLNDPIWIIVVFALGLPGFTAPFGTTILGWIAVAQIRRSAGKLHGLWLAVFDGLLFPLLALDGLIFIAVGLGLWVAGLGWKRTSTPTIPLSYLLFVAVLLGFLLLVDWLIIHAVWRVVNKPVGASVQPVQKTDRFWQWFAVVVFAMIAIPFLISIVGLLAAIAIPNFAKARAQAQANAQRAAAQLTINLPAAQNLTFGPVVERSLPVNTNGLTDVLNLESNQTMSISSRLPTPPTAGFVIFADDTESNVLFVRATWGLQVTPVQNLKWENVTPAGIAATVASRDNLVGIASVNRSKLPATFLFRTGSGLAGAMQVSKTDENTVNLRYKFVRQFSTNAVFPVESEAVTSLITASKPIPPEAVKLFNELHRVFLATVPIVSAQFHGYGTNSLPKPLELQMMRLTLRQEEIQHELTHLVQGTADEAASRELVNSSWEMMQINPNKEREKWEQLRAKIQTARFEEERLMVEAGAADFIKPQASKLTFDEWREATLFHPSAGSNCCVNFDSGAVLTPPPEILKAMTVTNRPAENNFWTESFFWATYRAASKETNLLANWIENSNVDAVPLGTDGLVVLCPVHVEGRDVTDTGDGWEKRISPAWLLWKLYYEEQRYAAQRPFPTNAYEVLTFTPQNHRTSQDLCLFRTRSGNYGILQITGFTENPRGVKLRYKLVQSVAASASFGREQQIRKALEFAPVVWLRGASVSFVQLSTDGRKATVVLDHPELGPEEVVLTADDAGRFTGSLKLAANAWYPISLLPADSQRLESQYRSLPAADAFPPERELVIRRPEGITNCLLGLGFDAAAVVPVPVELGGKLEDAIELLKSNNELDPESGHLRSVKVFLESLKNNAEVDRWAHDHGVDALVWFGDNEFQIVDFDAPMQMLYLPEGWPHLSPDRVKRALITGGFREGVMGNKLSASFDNSPVAYAFRTRANAIGAWRFSGKVGDPMSIAIKLRYKLVQNSTSTNSQ